MIRIACFIIALVLAGLLMLNVALTIGIITRHPFEWIGAIFFFLIAANLPWPGVYGEGWRRDRPVQG